jgi:methionyl-tRNA synthetase
MTWLALLADVFEVCVLPLLGVLTMYIVKFIQIKSEEITGKVNNDLADKYVNMLAATIENCVIATNQTYVEALKNAGKFDAEAQKTAFNMTKNAVMSILSDEAKKYLENAVGDLNEYITQQIEASVNINK